MPGSQAEADTDFEVPEGEQDWPLLTPVVRNLQDLPADIAPHRQEVVCRLSLYEVQKQGPAEVGVLRFPQRFSSWSRSSMRDASARIAGGGTHESA